MLCVRVCMLKCWPSWRSHRRRNDKPCGCTAWLALRPEGKWQRGLTTPQWQPANAHVQLLHACELHQSAPAARCLACSSCKLAAEWHVSAVMLGSQVHCGRAGTVVLAVRLMAKLKACLVLAWLGGFRGRLSMLCTGLGTLSGSGSPPVQVLGARLAVSNAEGFAVCRFRNDEVARRLGTGLATPVLASDGHRIGAM